MDLLALYVFPGGNIEAKPAWGRLITSLIEI